MSEIRYKDFKNKVDLTKPYNDQNITITITNKHQYISNHEVNLDLPSFAPECAINENLEDTSKLEEDG